MSSSTGRLISVVDVQMVKKLNIEFDTVYEITIKNVEQKIQFLDMSFDELMEIYADGRILSHFLERKIEHWFSLKRVNQTGYDHINICDVDEFDDNKKEFSGQRFDQKTFTKRGLNFMPSSQIGAGRKFNETVAHKHASEIDYICCDGTNLANGKITIIFKHGNDLVAEFPKCKVSFKDRCKLFLSKLI